MHYKERRHEVTGKKGLQRFLIVDEIAVWVSFLFLSWQTVLFLSQRGFVVGAIRENQY
jgi:hypothetical protein